MSRGKPSRGWFGQSGFLTVTRTDVDNVAGRFDVMIDGVAFDDESVIAGETQEYFIKRIILDMDVVPVPTALNQSGMIPFDVAVVVADQGLFEFASTDAPWTANGFMDQAYEVLVETCARVCRVDSQWAYASSAAGEPATVVPDSAYHNRFTWDIAYKGGLNVKPSQALYVGLCQSFWHQQGWLVGDSVILDWSLRALVQARKGQ